MASRRRKRLFSLILCLFVLVMLVLIVRTAREVIRVMQPPDPWVASGCEERGDCYYPFHVEHLHPFYYFFLPYDAELLDRVNNPVVSIDENGFRGDGPGKAGDKKLAFVLGGSTAFGFHASSNETTFSGYLNELQDEFHFVNAAVPGWISNQELYRVAIELLQYEPDLVMTLSGFNDASISYKYRHQYRVGTPDSYPYLARKVDDIRERRAIRVDRDVLVEVLGRIFSFVGIDDAPEAAPPVDAFEHALTETEADRAEEAATNYVRNLQRMHDLTAANEAAFLAVWQPAFFLHGAIREDDRVRFGIEKRFEFNAYLERFHRRTLELLDAQSIMIDLARVFDAHFETIPSDDTVFTDECHLGDRGFEIVAQEVVDAMREHGLLTGP